MSGDICRLSTMRDKVSVMTVLKLVKTTEHDVPVRLESHHSNKS